MLHCISVMTKWLAYTALLVTLTACDSPTDVDPALYPCLTADSTIGNRTIYDRVWTIDDEYAALARDVPGFGGMFYNTIRGVGSVGLNVYLVPGSDVTRAHGQFGAFNVLDAKYDYLQLLSCYRTATNIALSMAGVYSGDIDEVINRIVYGVKDSTTAQLVRSKLVDAKIPAAIVKFEITSPGVLVRPLPQAGP